MVNCDLGHSLYMAEGRIKFLVPHRGTIVLGKLLIFDFLAYKHVLRPQDAKKPVFKKSLYVCVCVRMYVRTYVCM